MINIIEQIGYQISLHALLLIIITLPIHGQMLTAPVLVQPEAEAQITMMLPYFQWTSANPSNGVIYGLKIVEIVGNQSPYQAIMANPSYFEAEGIEVTYYQYPLSARAISPGRYAWQVTAKQGAQNFGDYVNPGGLATAIATSEVSTFIVTSEQELMQEENQQIAAKEEEVLRKSGPYFALHPKLDAQYYTVTDGYLRFKIEDAYLPGTISYIITGAGIKRPKSQDLESLYGDNRYEIAVEGLGLKPDKIYILEVTERKGKTYKLSFTVKPEKL